MFVNAFSGQLPSTLGNLSKLTFAAITNSPGLTGTVPQEFGFLAASLSKYTPTLLRDVPLASLSSLSHGCMCPLFIGTLRLFDTQLEGTLPQEFCATTNLEIHLDCLSVSCDCCATLFCSPN